MTKTIIVRSCYITIGIWIAVTAILSIPINYQLSIINSYDDNGCRISLQNSSQIVCPDLPIRYDLMGNTLCSTCGNDSKSMTSESTIYQGLYLYIAFQVIAQLVAFLCWNEHFKWFRFEVKSCWGNGKTK